MHLPRRRREDFEASRVYEYPQHLRAAIEDAPTGAGVYVFHGESGDLPLYIGKSVNIRARLLSHLRNADEARLLRQTQRITCTRTAGEIGALLLEAQQIKQQHPLFNQKLRRNRQLCSLQLTGQQPQVVYSKDMDFASAPELHGLFASRHAALDALRSIADQNRLCYGALGLEKLAPGKACFRAAIGQSRACAGATKHPTRTSSASSPACWRCAWHVGPTPVPLAWSSATRPSPRSMWCATGATWAAPPHPMKPAN
jgi:excinuclease Cho